MSLSQSVSGISFSGLGSGIDTSSIIQKLMSIEQLPLQALQKQQTALQSEQQVYAAFRTQLQGISTAASALNIPSAFTTTAATSSDTSVATITTDSTVSAGAYDLTVSQLAQGNKVGSAAQTDTTASLALPPSTFLINGKQLTLNGTESLTDIARKINGAGAGVTASLIDGGTGSAYLTMSSTGTGAGSKISMSDLTGSTLSTLGFLGAGSAIRQPITNGATTVSFASQTNSLQTAIPGLPQNLSLTVGGSTIAIDTSTDSLQSIANKLSAIPNVQATVRPTTLNGTTTYQLDVKGSNGTTPVFTGGQLSDALGLTQTTAGHELLAAQDAKYTLDSIALTSPSNTVTTAIPGGTITLLKGTIPANGTNPATPSTATLSLSKDVTAATTKVQALVDAYNNAVDFISSQSAFDATSFKSGPLFGDSVAQQVQSNLVSMVVQTVPGITGTYTSLQSMGFAVDDKNHLTFDSSAFGTALTTDPTAVGKLFQAAGSSTDAGLNYVSSTSKTVAAGAGSYNVQITQPATQGSYLGQLAQTNPSTFDEALTFNGTLFGSTAYKLTIPTGSSPAETVTAINSDGKLKNLVSASLDTSGKLLITSKKYGASGNFTVGSDHDASASDSGIGYGSGGTAVTGLDVSGTINGEAATGAGQYLTGNTGNKTTDGLQIQYTGSSTGNVGSLSFTKGVASSLGDMMLSFTDPTTGLLTATDNSTTAELSDIANEITSLQAYLVVKQAELTTKYNNMESAITNLKSQSSQLAAFQSGSTTG